MNKIFSFYTAFREIKIYLILFQQYFKCQIKITIISLFIAIQLFNVYLIFQETYNSGNFVTHCTRFKKFRKLFVEFFKNYSNLFDG